VDVSDQIKKRRAQLKLMPKSQMILNLKSVVTQSDSIDEIRLAEKAVADLESCYTEDQLIMCILQWSRVAVKQSKKRWQIMTGIGALLMQTEV
jgi:hypothetical protein